MDKPFKGDVFNWAYVPTTGRVVGTTHDAAGFDVPFISGSVLAIYALGDRVVCEVEDGIYHLRTLMPTIQQAEERGLIDG